jgi:hypothetical protein
MRNRSEMQRIKIRTFWVVNITWGWSRYVISH